MVERKSRTAHWNSEQITDWLLREGRLINEISDLISVLSNKLIEAGAPVWRFRLSMRTLHPLTTAFTISWDRETDHTEFIESAHGIENRAEFIGSPIQIMVETQKPYRKNLNGDLLETDHNVLFELKARGATDYYGIPFRFSKGSSAIVIVTTDEPNGFTDHDLESFNKIALVLTPIAEVFNASSISRAIADTYLGTRTGSLVLDGQITRGHVEQISAAILMSDIRDWTGINNRLSPQDALNLANRYFELISHSVEEFDGEILKFIGDGVLAIFPGDKESGTSDSACQNALNAAIRAMENAPAALEDLEFGLGLHFGKVLYGNIGSTTRLDFTVLGQAVNLAARIEGLCSGTGQPLLFSEEFANQIEEPNQLVTETKLKGQKEISRIFTIIP